MAFIESELRVATDLAVQAVTLCSTIIQTAIRERSLLSLNTNLANLLDTPIHHSHRHSNHYSRQSSNFCNNNNSNNTYTPQRPSFYRSMNTNNSSSSNSNSNFTLHPPSHQRTSQNPYQYQQQEQQQQQQQQQQQPHLSHKVPHPPPSQQQQPITIAAVAVTPTSSTCTHPLLPSPLEPESRNNNYSSGWSSDEDKRERNVKETTMSFVDEQEKMWCTQIAYNCEEAMMSVLQNNTPLYNIVNVNKVFNETDNNNFNNNNSNNDNPTWVIMPINNPRGCGRGNPETCSSIALVVNNSIILSIISIPCLNEMYSATRGKGAFCNGQRIHVSNVTSLSQAVVFLPEPWKRCNNRKRSMRVNHHHHLLNTPSSIATTSTTTTPKNDKKHTAVFTHEQQRENEEIEQQENNNIICEQSIVQQQQQQQEQEEEEEIIEKSTTTIVNVDKPIKQLTRKDQEQYSQSEEEQQELAQVESNDAEEEEESDLHALLQVHAALSKRPVHSLRQINNITVQCAFIAAGRAEVFFDTHVSRFACAAGKLLVSEAGGVVIDLHQQHHCDYNNNNLARGICVCNNKTVADEVQAILRDNNYSL